MALTQKPRKGQWLKWADTAPHQVIEMKDDGICWIRDPQGNATCFIAHFSRDNTFNTQVTICNPPASAKKAS